MGRTAEREASYAFTDPYYYRDNCLVVKAGGELDDIKGLSDLAGKNVTVTTQLGTGWVNLLDQIPDVTLGANYETTSECFMAISNGVADVCVIDVPTAESAAMTNSDLKIIYLDSSDKFEGDEEMTNVCIATRLDDTELRDKLQSAMDSIGWNDKDVMDETMETAISLQPAAN
jgi:putative lysine transport system substrate-binding protein